MKRILIIVDDDTFTRINKVKEQNSHTWEQVLLSYAKINRRDKTDGKNNNIKKQAGN